MDLSNFLIDDDFLGEGVHVKSASLVAEPLKIEEPMVVSKTSTVADLIKTMSLA
jgi:hypothetical protein